MIWVKRILLAVVALFVGAVIYLANTNPAIRNLPYIVTYDRAYDAYAQTDTTATDVTARVDASGREAGLVTAFFGLDNALPKFSSWAVCKGSGGKDGMPIIFSHEVDPATIEPGDIKVTTASGAVGDLECLTMAPADGAGELRTALLVGNYGRLEDQPVTVEVVGNVLSLDGALNFNGARVDVTPLEQGPSMVVSEVLPENMWNLGGDGSQIPWGGGSFCPVDTRQVIRVSWDGGITKPNNVHIYDFPDVPYEIMVETADGPMVVAPMALADLRDNDNNHLLCLDTDAPATLVSLAAGEVTDPREDLNVATSIAVPAEPGILFTQPSIGLQ
ncbi:MAG: hypothetical protein AAF198_02040 [Pseudomonadota bacterium]